MTWNKLPIPYQLVYYNWCTKLILLYYICLINKQLWPVLNPVMIVHLSTYPGWKLHCRKYWQSLNLIGGSLPKHGCRHREEGREEGLGGSSPPPPPDFQAEYIILHKIRHHILVDIDRQLRFVLTLLTVKNSII